MMTGGEISLYDPARVDPCSFFRRARRYEQSEWGWKEREKREEMNDERAWYLLARDGDSAPVAFSHFRFDVECGEEVLYW